MNNTLEDMSLSERFEHIFRVLSGSRFQKCDGIGNEAPYFVCPYDPADAEDVELEITHLIDRLRTDSGIRVLCLDLYEISLDILEQREPGFLQKLLEKEPGWPRETLLRLLQNVLDPADYLIPALADRLAREAHDVCFLKGVGKVFPYIRTHTVLSNLHATHDSAPVLLFFPGNYVKTPELGSCLELFGRLYGDKYYRAFNILHYTA